MRWGPAVWSVVGCSALVSTAHAAPEPALRTMTLDDALAYARTHQLAFTAAKQRIEAGTKDAEAVSAQWLPRLGAFVQLVGATANNSTTTLLGNAAVDIPRVGGTKVSSTMDMQPYASTAVAVGIRQELYDFGRIAAERSAVETLVEVERQRTRGLGLDVTFTVSQAYYAVLAAHAVADASRAAFERASQHRDLARANVQSGMRPPIELTRAEADTARYEAGTMRADAALHVARGVLAATIGAPDIEVDVAPAAGEPNALPSLDALLVRAGDAPLVKELRARLDAQRAETSRLEAQTRPNLFATAALSSRAGGSPPSAGPVPTGDGWLPVVPNYDVGIVLSWPLVEPTFSRRADASRAREGAFGAEAELAMRNQRALIANAWREADVAMRSLGALVHAADAARANYEQAEQRFKVGLGTSTELADAQAVRADADIQLAVGRFQMARTRAVLARAIAEVR